MYVTTEYPNLLEINKKNTIFNSYFCYWSYATLIMRISDSQKDSHQHLPFQYWSLIYLVENEDSIASIWK
jgi:thiaminase